MATNRVARPHRYQVPSRAELLAQFDALAADPSPAMRAAIADWATEYLVFHDPALYPDVTDAAVQDALVALSGADLPSTDRPFLHGPQDVAAWRAALEGAPRERTG